MEDTLTLELRELYRQRDVVKDGSQEWWEITRQIQQRLDEEDETKRRNFEN